MTGRRVASIVVRVCIAAPLIWLSYAFCIMGEGVDDLANWIEDEDELP